MSPFRSGLLALPLLLLVGSVSAATPPAPAVLVYRDGDRTAGRLIEHKGGTIVFESVRFGRITVAESEAEIVAASPVPSGASASAVSPPPAGPPASTSAAEKPEHAAHSEQRAAMNRLDHSLRKIFGPWHGRLAVSTELVQGDNERRGELAELRFGRKWARDELRLETRYEFRSTDSRTDTDLLKSSAAWRHHLSPRWFVLAHPRLEWNSHYVKDARTVRYLLLQQEVGAGAFLINSKKGKLSVGLSGNQYDLWVLSEPQGHFAKFAPSAFIEAELNLRWGVRLTERGVRYFSFHGGDTGWESEFELGKRLTETLTLALHHDVRFNDPDFRLQDNATWRMLLGFDF